MGRLRVSTFIRAPRSEVWNVVRDIGSHVHWMGDAQAIRFHSPKQSGVGTTFECDTKVGPFRVTDRMEVTEWREGRVMGVRHVGRIGGGGRFSLKRRPGGTVFMWEERLRFPWWLGGAVTSTVAKPVLRHIWKENLGRLKTLVEAGVSGMEPVDRRGRWRRRA